MLNSLRNKIVKSLGIPESYLKYQNYKLDIPHCKPGDLFYCNKEDSDYYQYYIYIIGDFPTVEGTGYEYYMIKEGFSVVRTNGAPRHIDDSIYNLLTPVYDVSIKAKILLLVNGI